MQNSNKLSILALTVGVTGLVVALTQDPTNSVPMVDAVMPAEELSGEKVAARLEALAEENSRLRQRIDFLEMRPKTAARLPVEDSGVTRAEFDALRQELQAALQKGGAIGRPFVESEELFKQRLETTLEGIRKDEAVEQVRAKQSARLEQLDGTMTKLNTWLELSPPQSDRMRSALLAQHERDSELVRRWEAGEDPELLGEQKRLNRETHRSELLGILDARQLETYESRGRGGKR